MVGFPGTEGEVLAAGLVNVGATVASGACDQAFGPGEGDPFSGREEKVVATRFISNSLEFEGIKTGVADAFPDTEKQDGLRIRE